VKVSEMIEELKKFNPTFDVMVEQISEDKLAYHDIEGIFHPDDDDFDGGNEELVILELNVNNGITIIDNSGIDD